MKKYVSRIHYLTQDLPHRTHVEQAEIACGAGANWLQYRCFSKPDEELLQDIHHISAICDEWGATLIITAHAHLVPLADVQGLHVEDLYADLLNIRALIGDDKTLGASANSFDDIRRQAATGTVDYFGCGPFRFTTTKPNDHPLLGTEGYREIIKKMQGAGLEVPVLAVGGVTKDEVPALFDTGVYGIAVSAAVNRSDQPAAAYKELYKLIC